MATYHVLLYANTTNTLGRPPEWPAIISPPYEGNVPPLPLNWIAFTDHQLEQYLELHRPAYTAWNNAYRSVRQAQTAHAKLVKRVAERRWEIETGGYEIPGSGGARVATDDRSQFKMEATARRAEMDPQFVVPDWKDRDGVWHSIPREQFIALTQAAYDYIKDAYKREQELQEELAETDPTNLQAVMAMDKKIEAFWPIDDEGEFENDE